MPNKKFPLFLREAEFRCNMNKRNKEEKMKTIKLIKEIYNPCKFKFGEIEKI